MSRCEQSCIWQGKTGVVLHVVTCFPLRPFQEYPKAGILKSGPFLQFNPNQTHLSMRIRVFKIIRKSQVGEFDQDWTSREKFEEPCPKESYQLVEKGAFNVPFEAQPPQNQTYFKIVLRLKI